MATKLCQLIAIEKGVKNTSARVITDLHQASTKRDLFLGFNKSYQPKDEENAERLQPEEKLVQKTVKNNLKTLKEPLVRALDVVASKEASNAKATADVVVDGTVLIKDAPVCFLLSLEKTLTELHTFVSKLPTLSADANWSINPQNGLWVTPERETLRTKKVTKHVVVVQPTDRHPAQTATDTEDVVVGTWRTVNLSGEMSPVEQQAMLEKIERLRTAVKFAREEANSTEVTDLKCGEKLFGYVFGI